MFQLYIKANVKMIKTRLFVKKKLYINVYYDCVNRLWGLPLVGASDLWVVMARDELVPVKALQYNVINSFNF